MRKTFFMASFLVSALSITSFASVPTYTNQEALASLLASSEFKTNIAGELQTVVIKQTAAKVGQVFIFQLTYHGRIGPMGPKRCGVMATISTDIQQLGAPTFQKASCAE